MQSYTRYDTQEKAYKQQKVALYCLLGSTYLFFVGLVLGDIQAIADYSYSLHEIISSTANLMLITPFLLLIYIFYRIRYLIIRGRVLPELKSGIKGLFVAASIIGIFTFTFFKLNEYESHGVLTVQGKIQEENNYYLIINDKKIKVTESEYYLTTQNEVYLGSYKWNKLSPDEGKLLTIKPD
ncbi:hypothetical protein [Aquibacillus kalidii]|uniref:hypothetical protein n=1 Tax=Aquibacillus kalidii TaxID=2762597 RepID=UPI0016457C07|nr:hypothetical protein [Aquibacillus kalidii]